MQSPSPTASPPPSSSRELKPGSGGPPGGPPGPPGPGPDELFRPKTLKFWLILLSNFLAMFLVALDRTIVATAIPRITDDFHSLGDIGWYGSAYMLTTATSQLVFGRLYKFYNMKWYVLVALPSHLDAGEFTNMANEGSSCPVSSYSRSGLPSAVLLPVRQSSFLDEQSLVWVRQASSPGP